MGIVLVNPLVDDVQVGVGPRRVVFGKLQGSRGEAFHLSEVYVSVIDPVT